MTEKQEKLLSKYLSKDRLCRLDEMGGTAVSGCIDLLLHIRIHHQTLGSTIDIPHHVWKPVVDEVERVEALVNSDLSKFKCVKSVHASLFAVHYLDFGTERVLWYEMQQIHVRDGSKSAFLVNESGCSFEGVLSVLFDHNIMSVSALLEYYWSLVKA